MSRWYRAYEGTVTDAKLGEVALVAGCSRSVVIAAWHSILEDCAAVNDGGRYETTPRRVAVILSEPVNAIEAVFGELEALGLIGGGAVSAWKRRQFEGATSTERSRKHREAKRNADATLQQQDATPPETDTDTDTQSSVPSDCERAPERPARATPRKAKLGTAEQILIDGLGGTLATRVIGHRKAKKVPMSERAAELLVKGFLATGDPEAAIDMMIAKNWQGFQLEWYENERNRTSASRGSSNGSDTIARLHAALSGENGHGPSGRGPGFDPSGWGRADERAAPNAGKPVLDLAAGDYAEWPRQAVR